MQQSPTGPLEISYGDVLKTDFWGQSVPQEQQGTSQVAGGHPATSAFTAYVSCDSSNNTLLQDLNGNPITTITAPKGTTVYWISSKAFSMVTTNFPAGLCSNTDPSGNGLTEAQCDVAMSGQSKTYTVQATACTAKNAELMTTN
jgi:hypothetical protein